MKHFVILITGSGQGCDYALDCNKTWKYAQSESIEHLRKTLADEMWGNLGDYGGDYEKHWNRHNETYHSFEIIEISKLRTVSAAELISEHWKTAKKEAESKAEQEREAADLAEFERLQKKFGART